MAGSPIKEHLKAVKSSASDHFATIATPVAEYTTEITKGIKFAANKVSLAMDTGNGGVSAHGGFHRVFGGHSFFDLDMWQKYGIRYPIKVMTDTLTSNGAPMPGVETATNAISISPSTATDWGSLNVGDVGGIALALADTTWSVVKIARGPSALDGKELRLGVKGSVKILTGASHGNIPPMVFGVADVALAARSVVRSSFNPFDPDAIEALGFDYDPAF